MLERSAFFNQDVRQKFLSFCVKTTNESGVLIEEHIVDRTMTAIYSYISAREISIDELKTLINEVFKENLNFSKFLIIRSFIYLLELAKHESDTKEFLEIFDNVVDGVKSIYGEVLMPEFVSPEVKKEDTIGFAEAISDGDANIQFHTNLTGRFRDCQNNIERLEFFNLYKDIPVKNNVEILEIKDETVVFKMPMVQILAIIEEKNAYIVKNNSLRSHIRADIVEHNVSNQTIELVNFRQLKSMPATNRQTVRVQPDEFTSIVLSNSQGQSVRGMMYDISLGGLAVLSSDNLSAERGDKLTATFELNVSEDQVIKITQELKLVVLINYKGALRYCMQSIPNEQKQYIEVYTKRRKEETIKELEKHLSKYKPKEN